MTTSTGEVEVKVPLPTCASPAEEQESSHFYEQFVWYILNWKPMTSVYLHSSSPAEGRTMDCSSPKLEDVLGLNVKAAWHIRLCTLKTAKNAMPLLLSKPFPDDTPAPAGVERNSPSLETADTLLRKAHKQLNALLTKREKSTPTEPTAAGECDEGLRQDLLAMTLNNLGCLEFFRHNVQRAMLYFESCLRIQQQSTTTDRSTAASGTGMKCLSTYVNLTLSFAEAKEHMAAARFAESCASVVFEESTSEEFLGMLQPILAPIKYLHVKAQTSLLLHGGKATSGATGLGELHALGARLLAQWDAVVTQAKLSSGGRPSPSVEPSAVVEGKQRKKSSTTAAKEEIGLYRRDIRHVRKELEKYGALPPDIDVNGEPKEKKRKGKKKEHVMVFNALEGYVSSTSDTSSNSSKTSSRCSTPCSITELTESPFAYLIESSTGGGVRRNSKGRPTQRSGKKPPAVAPTSKRLPALPIEPPSAPLESTVRRAATFREPAHTSSIAEKEQEKECGFLVPSPLELQRSSSTGVMLPPRGSNTGLQRRSKVDELLLTSPYGKKQQRRSSLGTPTDGTVPSPREPHSAKSPAVPEAPQRPSHKPRLATAATTRRSSKTRRRRSKQEEGQVKDDSEVKKILQQKGKRQVEVLPFFEDGAQREEEEQQQQESQSPASTVQRFALRKYFGAQTLFLAIEEDHLANHKLSVESGLEQPLPKPLPNLSAVYRFLRSAEPTMPRYRLEPLIKGMPLPLSVASLLGSTSPQSSFASPDKPGTGSANGSPWSPKTPNSGNRKNQLPYRRLHVAPRATEAFGPTLSTTDDKRAPPPRRATRAPVDVLQRLEQEQKVRGLANSRRLSLLERYYWQFTKFPAVLQASLPRRQLAAQLRLISSRWLLLLRFRDWVRFVHWRIRTGLSPAPKELQRQIRRKEKPAAGSPLLTNERFGSFYALQRTVVTVDSPVLVQMQQQESEPIPPLQRSPTPPPAMGKSASSAALFIRQRRVAARGSDGGASRVTPPPEEEYLVPRATQQDMHSVSSVASAPLLLSQGSSMSTSGSGACESVEQRLEQALHVVEHAICPVLSLALSEWYDLDVDAEVLRQEILSITSAGKVMDKVCKKYYEQILTKKEAVVRSVFACLRAAEERFTGLDLDKDELPPSEHREQIVRQWSSVSLQVSKLSGELLMLLSKDGEDGLWGSPAARAWHRQRKQHPEGEQKVLPLNLAVYRCVFDLLGPLLGGGDVKKFVVSHELLEASAQSLGLNYLKELFRATTWFNSRSGVGSGVSWHQLTSVFASLQQPIGRLEPHDTESLQDYIELLLCAALSPCSSESPAVLEAFRLLKALIVCPQRSAIELTSSFHLLATHKRLAQHLPFTFVFSDGHTLLSEACRLGSFEMAALITQHCERVTSEFVALDLPRKGSPLVNAIAANAPDVVELLLAYPKVQRSLNDPVRAWDYATPLEVATMSAADPQLFALLKRNGAKKSLIASSPSPQQEFDADTEVWPPAAYHRRYTDIFTASPQRDAIAFSAASPSVRKSKDAAELMASLNRELALSLSISRRQSVAVERPAEGPQFSMAPSIADIMRQDSDGSSSDSDGESAVNEKGAIGHSKVPPTFEANIDDIMGGSGSSWGSNTDDTASPRCAPGGDESEEEDFVLSD